MKVSIIKYNAGNVQSVIFALNRLGIDPLLTDNPEEIRTSDKVIFPGVGEASSCMKSLRETGLDQLIPTLTQPVLGICVGLQLMCRHSEEKDTMGMGIFDLNVKKFTPAKQKKADFKVPQMGWNTISSLKSPLFKDIPDKSYIYYVHSFYAELGNETIATTDYVLPYSAALNKNNFYAVQFHTEKSSEVGGKILSNFFDHC